MAKHFVEAEELQAYLDRELEPARQAEVERHLAECRECAALVADLKRVSATLQRWQVEPAPASLRPPAFEPARIRQRWLWGRWQLALASTAAAALIVGAITILNFQRAQLIDAQKAMDLSSATEEQQPADRSRETPAVGSAPVVKDEKLRPKIETRTGMRQSTQASPKAEPPLPAPPPVSEHVARRARKDAPVKSYELEKSAGAASGLIEEKIRDAREPAQSVDALAPLPAPPPAQTVRRVMEASPSSQARRMVASRVSMTVEVKEFDAARETLERIINDAGGYVAQAGTSEVPDRPRRTGLTVRVPAEKLDGFLEQVRALGRVVNEQLSAEEVAEQLIDLEARLRNTRATEQRLLTVLEDRTGKVGDVLQVEREIARTRTEIERIEAQRQNLLNRVEFTTVEVTLTEEYEARLEPARMGTATKLRNATVEGYENFVGMLLGFVYFFARYGLILLFWLGLARLGWLVVRTRLSLALRS